MKVSFSPDIVLSGWLGLKHQLTNSLFFLCCLDVCKTRKSRLLSVVSVAMVLFTISTQNYPRPSLILSRHTDTRLNFFSFFLQVRYWSLITFFMEDPQSANIETCIVKGTRETWRARGWWEQNVCCWPTLQGKTASYSGVFCLFCFRFSPARILLRCLCLGAVNHTHE